MQHELLDACNRATAAATSSSEPRSAAAAVLSATGKYVNFCEYVRRIAMGVLREDEDGMPYGKTMPYALGQPPSRDTV